MRNIRNMRNDNHNNKAYTIRKVEDNLSSMPQHITQGSDVGSEPFPFTEEDNKMKEQYQFGSALGSNEKL